LPVARHRTSSGEDGADEQGQGCAAADATRAGAGQREDQADQGRPRVCPTSATMMLGILEAVIHVGVIKLFRLSHFYSPEW
jgi:hypothetical protein